MFLAILVLRQGGQALSWPGSSGACSHVCASLDQRRNTANGNHNNSLCTWHWQQVWLQNSLGTGPPFATALSLTSRSIGEPWRLSDGDTFEICLVSRHSHVVHPNACYANSLGTDVTTAIEHPKMERTHKGHQVQLQALCRTMQNSNPMLESTFQFLIELWYLGPCPLPWAARSMPTTLWRTTCP